MLNLAQIWGNVASSNILKADTNTTNHTFNYYCGASDCPGNPGGAIKHPMLSTVLWLFILIMKKKLIY